MRLDISKKLVSPPIVSTIQGGMLIYVYHLSTGFNCCKISICIISTSRQRRPERTRFDFLWKNSIEASQGQADTKLGESRAANRNMLFWLVVWLPFFIFPLILGNSSSQLTNSYFSQGWPNHQPEYAEN